MNEIKIGTFYAREGRHKIRICGKTTEGAYIARQVLLSIRHSDLLKFFDQDMLVAGAILRLANGRIIQLVGLRSSGYWDNEYADEAIVLTPEDLESLEAERHAAVIYSAVLPPREHGHPLRNPPGSNSRFLPRRMD